MSQLSAERANLPFLHLFVLFALNGLCDSQPTLGTANYFTWFTNLNANLLQKLPEIMFYWLPGHPLVQLSGHVKLPVTQELPESL